MGANGTGRYAPAVEATEQFAVLMTVPEAEVAVDEVALLVAAHARADLDPRVERQRLDDLAAGCTSPTAQGVRDHLFGELGFRGDRLTYHDPRNSYLDAVVRRRLGLPITLAVLTIGVARRIGVTLTGVGMPGHFLVGDPTRDDHYLDVFDGGTSLDTAGCERIYRSQHGPDAPFHPSYLQPVGTHAITARLLNNLRSVFVARHDQRNLVWVLRLRSMVPGVPAAERADLAGALAASGRFAEAAREMTILAERSDDPDVAVAFARHAERLRSRLN
jgi:regulator of sirC expression with transglutaminase-like and TPR domain